MDEKTISHPQAFHKKPNPVKPSQWLWRVYLNAAEPEAALQNCPKIMNFNKYKLALASPSRNLRWKYWKSDYKTGDDK